MRISQLSAASHLKYVLIVDDNYLLGITCWDAGVGSNRGVIVIRRLAMKAEVETVQGRTLMK